MCSAGIALGLVGGYAQYQGTKLQSAAQAQEYAATAKAQEYAATVADNNAKISDLQAADAVLRGEQKQIDLQREVGQMRGTGRTGYAAGNVQVGVGSAMDWEQDLSSGAKRESIAIDRNTQMEKWGFQVQANNERNQANLDRMGAVNTNAAAGMAQSAGGFASATSLLSTASRFADQFPVASSKPRTPNSYAGAKAGSGVSKKGV